MMLSCPASAGDWELGTVQRPLLGTLRSPLSPRCLRAHFPPSRNTEALGPTHSNHDEVTLLGYLAGGDADEGTFPCCGGGCPHVGILGAFLLAPTLQVGKLRL